MVGVGSYEYNFTFIVLVMQPAYYTSKYYVQMVPTQTLNLYRILLGTTLICNSNREHYSCKKLGASQPTLLLFGQETRDKSSHLTAIWARNPGLVIPLNCYLGKKPGTSHPNSDCFHVLNNIWARNPGQVTPLYCYLGKKPGTSHPT